MKLLLENWRKFIKEQLDDTEEYDYEKELQKQGQELETKYFGNEKDIGRLVYDLYDRAIKNLTAQGSGAKDIAYYQEYLTDSVVQEVKRLTGKDIEFMGRGSFRSTFTYDNQLVIKIDITVDGAGKKMNQDDKEIGLRSDFGELFPRCYSWANDYSWIVLEKVEKIEDFKTLISFFPNKYISQSMSQYYCMVLRSCIEYKVANFERDSEAAKLAIDSMEDPINYTKKSLDVDYKKVLEEFNKVPLFNKVCAAAFAFKMYVPESIKPFNSGTGSDGRFVILDSSVRETIKQGLKAFGHSI
jgi:hypothetical protein